MLTHFKIDINLALSVTINRAAKYAHHVSSTNAPRFSMSEANGICTVTKYVETYTTMLSATSLSNRHQTNLLRISSLHKHRTNNTVTTIRPTNMSIVPMLTARKEGYHSKLVIYATRAYFGRNVMTNREKTSANVRVTLCMANDIRRNLLEHFACYPFHFIDTDQETIRP